MDKENIVRFQCITTHLFEFSGHEFKVSPIIIAVFFSLDIINIMNVNMEWEENSI